MGGGAYTRGAGEANAALVVAPVKQVQEDAGECVQSAVPLGKRMCKSISQKCIDRRDKGQCPAGPPCWQPSLKLALSVITLAMQRAPPLSLTAKSTLQLQADWMLAPFNSLATVVVVG